MRRFLLAAALTATFAVGAAAATPTAAAPLPQAATCTGVWVVVDFGSLGGTSTKCATSFDTGTKALKSAGFSVTIDDGFVYKIAGKPSKPDINKAYWSYWHATKQDDGSYSDWSYSNVGANGYHPTRGNAEGWRYQSLSEGKVPPAARPPKADTASPTPKPTATKPKPTAKPSAKPTPKPTATKSATTSPSASATASVSASATASPSATASASATPTPSATPTVDATPTDVVTPSAEEATATAEPAPDAGGSPVGAIAAGVVVVAAGAGLGGWWWLKGRKP